jgi:acetoacetyl-CoA reductase
MDSNGKRIALVTGATGGLGTAICKKLVDDGYRVIGTYRSKEKNDIWQAQLKKDGYQIETILADVSNFQEVGQGIDHVTKTIGDIDILVNNAGITRDRPFHKMSKEDWDEVIGSNLDSVFNCTRHVIEGMRERNYGRIINISSVNGQRGQFGQANYSAAKAGMHGFTKTLAVESASKGITVNTISPGYIATDMVMAVREDVRNAIIAQIPMGRLGGTDEIAYLVSFLASEKANYITGANIAINGGQHMY